MTGHVAVKGKESLKYMRAKAVDVNEWPPKYAKVQLSLSEDTHMAFCDSRCTRRHCPTRSWLYCKSGEGEDNMPFPFIFDSMYD